MATVRNLRVRRGEILKNRFHGKKNEFKKLVTKYLIEKKRDFSVKNDI